MAHSGIPSLLVLSQLPVVSIITATLASAQVSPVTNTGLASDGKAVRTTSAVEWSKRLTFLASFDHGIDADFSQGDRRVHTAKDLDRKESEPGNQIESISIAEGQGRYGNALHFSKKTKPCLFYSAQHVGYRPENWSGTLSVWMKLDPDNDLRPGYCDPVLLTDKQWDQACLFVDFDRDLPRDFRLGVFPDYDVWNPQAVSWDEIPVDKRPMVVVRRPPFSSDQWTHVCFSWENANVPGDPPGKANLYVNGQHQGWLEQVMRFTWDVEKAAITIGIYYIGLMDELAVFDSALTESEVGELYQLPGGLVGQLDRIR